MDSLLTSCVAIKALALFWWPIDGSNNHSLDGVLSGEQALGHSFPALVDKSEIKDK